MAPSAPLTQRSAALATQFNRRVATSKSNERRRRGRVVARAADEAGEGTRWWQKLRLPFRRDYEDEYETVWVTDTEDADEEVDVAQASHSASRASMERDAKAAAPVAVVQVRLLLRACGTCWHGE